MFNVYDDIYDMEDMIDFLSKMGADEDDSILKYNIVLAHKSIQNYLNADDKQMLDDNGKGIYSYEVIQFVIYIMEQSKSWNIASKKQGERSISYHSNYDKIPQHIINSLPLPYARSL